ncbi:MAG: AMP-binding protein [Chloroflexi bacterium]|nr:AMP-binding protein [Chloroflexota bacterium]
MREVDRSALHALLARHGDRIAVVAGERSITFRELDAEAARTAAGLERRGFERGDVLAVWLPNVPEWLVLFFAAARLGVLVVPVSTRARAFELAHLFRATHTHGVVYRSGFLGIDFPHLLEQAAADLPPLQHVFDVAAGGSYEGLQDATQFGAATGEPGDLVCAFGTSGTTGNPKLAAHDQASILEHSRRVSRAFDLRPGDALLCALPFSGVFGFNAALGALAAGATCVLEPVFDGAEAAELMTRHGVTHFFGSDAMVQAVLDAADPSATWAWRRGGIANFAGLARGVIERAEAMLGVRVTGLYGSSECFALMAAWCPEDPIERRALAGGVPISPEIRIRVVDTVSGALLPDDQPGELQVHGSNVLASYLNNPEATASAFTGDGWFRTGDLAMARADGFVFTARLKDTLRLHGYLVDPAEIEEYLTGLPVVEAAQVVGVAGRGGDQAVAFLRLAPGAVASEADLIASCRGGIADYKVPSRIVVVDEFPTVQSPNGTKIQKVRLRELAAELR